MCYCDRSQPPHEPRLDGPSMSQWAIDAIQEAEASKARLYEISGKTNHSGNLHSHGEGQSMECLAQGFAHSMMVDESFLLVTSHIDQGTREKFENGQFVNFVKLVAKDRIDFEEEHGMEMINKDGKPFWVPVSDKDHPVINSFNKWEQAFRVYSDIFLKANPSKAQEFIQYNHIIYTASLTYHWDNVYRYDKLFRMHVDRNPGRSWGIILQQAWALCLKDRINQNRANFDAPKSENRE